MTAAKAEALDAAAEAGGWLSMNWEAKAEAISTKPTVLYNEWLTVRRSYAQGASTEGG